MKDYLLPYFGQIDLDSLKEEYYGEIEFNGKEISVDINFENKSISETKMDIIKNFIENISDYDTQNKTYIENDYNNENGDVVKEYVKFHFEELENELSEHKLIDLNNKKISLENQLLNKMQLERIGFYPDGKYETASFAIFDYTLEGNEYNSDGRRKITDQIIVVNTDENGKLDNIGWES